MYQDCVAVCNEYFIILLVWQIEGERGRRRGRRRKEDRVHKSSKEEARVGEKTAQSKERSKDEKRYLIKSRLSSPI
jgi:hypothetical protein